LLLINKLPISQWKNKVFNSFEAPNFSIHPICKTIKKQIDDMGAIYTSMSGSGSTLYGIFDHPVDTSGIDGDYFVWQGILE
jgi:4-diphosphocytidyl-2-C-methyl-D-erythritol kinase